MVSNIGTSSSWPWPLRSRLKSAASTPYTTVIAVVLSATIVGR